MLDQVNQAKPNYGWGAAAPHSCDYLTRPVLELCRKFGGKRILDLGCGNGVLCRDLADAGYEVVGCDADAPGIELARKQFPQLRFEVASVYDEPEKLGEADFDLVVSTEVVEHLYAPRALPRFAAAVLKPGGRLIVSTPYHGWLKNVLLSLAGKWDSHHSPLWDGGHVKFWSRATLGQLLTEAGFQIEDFRGAGRLPFLWRSMIMTGRKAG